MGTAVRPANRSPGSWDAFADIDVFLDEVLAEPRRCDRGQSRRWPEWRCARPSRRSGVFVSVACSGERSDGFATSLRHALWAIRSLDQARPVAPAARSAAPRLAARLRGFPGAKRRWSSIVDPAVRRRAALIRGVDRRKEDPGRQNPCCGRQIWHPARDRCLAGEPARYERHRAGLRALAEGGFQGPAPGDLRLGRTSRRWSAASGIGHQRCPSTLTMAPRLIPE